jgi:uncharacterized coiled-coil protein SlyX
MAEFKTEHEQLADAISALSEKLDQVRNDIMTQFDEQMTRHDASTNALLAEFKTEIKQLADQIAGSAGNQAKLDAAADKLRALSDRMDAVTAEAQADNPPPAPPTA